MDFQEPFTDQELQMIDAIEASYTKKRLSRADHTREARLRTDRYLPSSLLASPSSSSFSLTPCQANLRMKYQPLSFGGQILYSKTSTEVQKAAVELLQFLEVKKKETGQVAIGFDIEWRPSFKRGVLPGKAAVMQICGDTSHCYVMHIIHSGIPPSLRSLLEDSSVLKVGIGIVNDATKIFNDYDVSVKGVNDLCYRANKKLGGSFKKWSLASLTEMLLCKEKEV
ncbi:Werner Syndrome-like exonuclease isoform X2 [Mangifera indica]|uniref:Werner Syndrome-like exonuclease isoform X2 n=1 Tax=Mangifera indica TaxID=29780 RepID=UPI001CFBDABD|nr:Werner Syndrome-like exonuclease isoform X2 [Mangifera indica]